MPNESLNIYLTAVEKAASAEGRHENTAPEGAARQGQRLYSHSVIMPQTTKTMIQIVSLSFQYFFSCSLIFFHSFMTNPPFI